MRVAAHAALGLVAREAIHDPDGVRDSDHARMNVDEFTELAVAAAWLNPLPDSPWHWDSNEEAIVWEDGSTIVFREELALILEQLPQLRLPRAGALILLLAACRGKIPESFQSGLRPIMESLRVISSLSAELLQGVQGRALLVGNLLVQASYGSMVKSKSVVNLLRSGESFSAYEEKNTGGSLADDVAPLWRSCAQLNAAELENLLRTGLAAAPEPVPELDFPTATQIGAFLDQILADPDLAPIAKVARQIMAAVSLPEALTHADDEALGGFSDLGNRGQLHRLLLSELANDDDILCMRIAMNEALYLRREPASDKPSLRLVVLLDAGLRMWGIPRVFATSTALAFLAKCGKHRMPEVYRASKESAVPSPIWTKPGLMRHLEALETEIHPGAALETLASLQKEEHSASTEFLVITHNATVASGEFQQVLHALFHKTGGALYVAGVDREGAISFSVTGAHGMKLLKEAHINPGNLLEKSTSHRAVPVRNRAAALHAIFQARPFPFLLPLDSPVETGWTLEHGGGICFTQKGDVWRWFGTGQGGVRLPVMPLKGTTIGFFPDETSRNWHLVKYRSNENRVDIARWNDATDATARAIQLQLPLGQGEAATIDGDVWSPRVGSIEHIRTAPLYAFARDAYIYLVFKDKAVVVSAATLVKVGEGDFPTHAKPIGTRFLRLGVAGFALEYGLFYWDGFALQVLKEKMQKVPGSSDPVFMFDRQGCESPWAVNSDGRIYSVAEPMKDFMMKPGKVVDAKISPEGNRVWLSYGGATKNLTEGTLVAHLKTKHFLPVHALHVKMGHTHALGGWAEPSRWSLRNKFSHIALCPSGCIALRSNKGYWVKIEFKQNAFTFVHDPAKPKSQDKPAEWGITQEITFSEPDRENTAGLRQAEWAEGSRAYLDPRGMLHLQSSDASIPEITFVLAESTAIPVWSSDGRKIGPKYFIGEHKPEDDDAQAIDGHVREFVGRIVL